MRKTVPVAILLIMVAFVAAVIAGQQGIAPAKPSTTVAPAAARAPEKTKAEQPKVAEMEKFTGTIEKIDEKEKVILVKGKKDSKSFVVDVRTKITRAGKDMPFSELKNGMDVLLDYKKEGERMIAASIKVAGPKAAPKEKAPEKSGEKKPPETPKK